LLFKGIKETRSCNGYKKMNIAIQKKFRLVKVS
jgi:hypothetical protein